MNRLKHCIFTVLLLLSCRSFGATIHFDVVNLMQDEFVWIDEHLAINIVKSDFGRKVKLPLKSGQHAKWSVVVPGDTIENPIDSNYLYELMYRSDTLRILAKKGAILGLTQYPEGNDTTFSLYDLETTTTLSSDKDLNVYIEISRFQSFIGY